MEKDEDSLEEGVQRGGCSERDAAEGSLQDVTNSDADGSSEQAAVVPLAHCPGSPTCYARLQQATIQDTPT
eukprot:423643-Pyramimonas_sp.AAC.2